MDVFQFPTKLLVLQTLFIMDWVAYVNLDISQSTIKLAQHVLLQHLGMEQTVLLIKDVSKDINGILFLEDVFQDTTVAQINFGME